METATNDLRFLHSELPDTIEEAAETIQDFIRLINRNRLPEKIKAFSEGFNYGHYFH